ncbi:MAG: MFS transporter [Deltaproteobacteria bacterium]|nr:MFS transporter [Deltaproteobacteria bacterium]
MSDAAVQTATPRKTFHPVVWLILYVPFGALGGFITIALTNQASDHGISITDGAWIAGSQMLTQWLKWLWAPAVDITLSPKRWYVLSTALSALGVFTMSAIPLSNERLGMLLVIIALASIINSVVGMSVEAMIASLTTPEEVGRVSAWFQAGNLGGNGVGGGLGLLLMQKMHATWMSGAIMGGLFMLCCTPLLLMPAVKAHSSELKPVEAVKNVATGLWGMLKTRVGFLTALLCMLPVSTGAASGTLTQAAVAAHWGATTGDVVLVQGMFAGFITAIGCFVGGWVCDRMNARTAYATFGIVLVVVAAAMAFFPPMPETAWHVAIPAIGFDLNVHMVYAAFNLVYAFGVGLSYAAFTAMVLVALKGTAAATGYNVYASLSNFPIWWLGLLLGWAADPAKGARHGPSTMLLTEAALGVVGVIVFAVATKAAGARAAAAEPTPEPAATA